MVSPARGTHLERKYDRKDPLVPRTIAHLTVCAGLLAALIAFPARARGQAEPDGARQATARTLFQEGLEYSDAGRWQEAVDRFGRAYRMKPTAEIAYNLAQ